MTELKRPPLGIPPRMIWVQQRIDDINAAIVRYAEAGVPHPKEWDAELLTAYFFVHGEVGAPLRASLEKKERIALAACRMLPVRRRSTHQYDCKCCECDLFDALKDGGYPVAEYANVFRCPGCLRVSYNARDAAEQYCGACRRFWNEELDREGRYKQNAKAGDGPKAGTENNDG